MGCAEGEPIGAGGNAGAGGEGGSGGVEDPVGGSPTTTVTTPTTTTGGGGEGEGGMPGDGGAGGGPLGFPPGSECDVDADCASGLCKEVLIDSGEKVCVTPCTTQEDCADYPFDGFCDPITAGSTDGYCVPHSPAHCLACDDDSKCGSLSELCFQAPGDIGMACHVDCSIAGEDACPAEYSCQPIDVNGTTRNLCRPNVASCVDAVGGFCDRVSIPQSCSRENAAGTCLGQRECIPLSKRFDVCGAQAPQCKNDCSLQDPAGCTVSFCTSAIDDAANCGACNSPCPGLNQPNDIVSCVNAMTCTFACQGESYDVDQNPGTGCERTDSPQGNHTTNTAVYLGSFPCSDGGSQQNMTGIIDSDTRTHSPVINGFNAATGSAPDFFRLFADGGACYNDLNLNFSVSGSSQPACYRLSAITSDGTYSCQSNGAGTCNISNGSGSYSDDTDMYFRIEKTCGTNVIEHVTYTVSGHL